MSCTRAGGTTKSQIYALLCLKKSRKSVWPMSRMRFILDNHGWTRIHTDRKRAPSLQNPCLSVSIRGKKCFSYSQARLESAPKQNCRQRDQHHTQHQEFHNDRKPRDVRVAVLQ